MKDPNYGPIRRRFWGEVLAIVAAIAAGLWAGAWVIEALR